jgi:hypothetical protein
MLTDELLRGGRAGAVYLMSLNVDTLWIADEVPATPILVAREPGDTASLHQAIDTLLARGKPFPADPILDPIPFGFAASIARYVGLRERYPQVAIMLGIGNVTELTEADTTGINALLFGIAAELHVAAVLNTSVSLHARRAVREADVARRIMHAAQQARCYLKGFQAISPHCMPSGRFPITPMKSRNLQPACAIRIFACRCQAMVFTCTTATVI